MVPKETPMQPEHLETAAKATAATVASYTSSGTLFIFGLTVNDFTALAGLALAFGTFLVNFYYQRKRSQK